MLLEKPEVMCLDLIILVVGLSAGSFEAKQGTSDE